MTQTPSPEDRKINALLEAMADAIAAEMPEIGFVLILGRSAETGTDGSLVSLSNVDDGTTVTILETVLARRRFLAARPEPTIQ